MSYFDTSAPPLQGKKHLLKAPAKILLMVQRRHSHKPLLANANSIDPPPIKGAQSVGNPFVIYSLII